MGEEADRLIEQYWDNILHDDFMLDNSTHQVRSPAYYERMFFANKDQWFKEAPPYFLVHRGYWRDIEGTVWSVHEMDQQHYANTIALLRRKNMVEVAQMLLRHRRLPPEGKQASVDDAMKEARKVKQQALNMEAKERRAENRREKAAYG